MSPAARRPPRTRVSAAPPHDPAHPAVPGPIQFARFAYPPNALGLCGPDDSHALLEYVAAGEVDGGLVAAAQGFEGAWPYLELLAGAGGIPDPLDPRVVEAYWIGSPLSDRVTVADLGNHLDSRFRRRAGSSWPRVEAAVTAGAGVCHQFHVFAVYPWVGLLRSSGGVGDRALEVLDRCRIRWGAVMLVEGETAVVSSAPLQLGTEGLHLGPPVEEVVRVSHDGYHLGPSVVPGDMVALHWDWACERLTPIALARLRHHTQAHLELANAHLAL